MIDKIIKKLGEYKTSGNHLIFKSCPFCGREKWKFYLNKDNLMFDCKSGSCNTSGHINRIARKLNIEVKHNKNSYEVVEQLNVNIRDFRPIGKEKDGIIDYMKTRGISKATLENSKVWNDPKTKAMVFPTIDVENKKYLCMSFRTLDKKIWKMKGSQQYLWNRHNSNYDNLDYIYITEGEIDALTLIEMGYRNVVSMPQGANSHDWIELEYKNLSKYKKIFLLYDNDDAGKIGLEKARKRLDFAILYTIDYKIFKDINEFYLEDPVGLKESLKDPIEIMQAGITNITDVKISTNKAISSGDKQLDYIYGGLRVHEISILTAVPGAGKTTYICNWIANLMEIGEKAFLYSGELSDSTTKNWLYQVISGKDNINYVDHPFRPGERIGTIDKETEKKIDKWVKNRLFLHKGDLANGFELIESMKKFHKRYGIKFFFLDNLSVIDLGSDKFGDQSRFSKELMGFVKEFGVHVVLVAHPKKQPKEESMYNQKGEIKPPMKMNKYDISGSADIVNLAHNVILMSKATEHMKLWLEQQIGDTERFKDLSMVMSLDKNREGGFVGEDVLYSFDKESKRFISYYNRNKLDENYSFDIIEVNSLTEAFGIIGDIIA